MRKILIALMLAIVPILALVACGPASQAATVPKPLTFGLYAGPAAHNGTIDKADYAGFGRNPAVAIYYGSWGSLNPAPVPSFLAQTKAQGIMPMIELQTGTDSLPTIAAGGDDAQIIALANHAHANGKHILMTFDHEMNGNWYPWGSSPVNWIKAWNHVTSVINAHDPGGVTWVWAPNVNAGGATLPSHDYWSDGGVTVQNVNEIGLDGYLCGNLTAGSCTQTFNSVFSASVATIRTYTKLPVIVAETAIGPPNNRDAEIQAEISAARSDGFQGVYWFNTRNYTLTAPEEKILANALN